MALLISDSLEKLYGCLDHSKKRRLFLVFVRTDEHDCTDMLPRLDKVKFLRGGRNHHQKLRIRTVSYIAGKLKKFSISKNRNSDKPHCLR